MTQQLANLIEKNFYDLQYYLFIGNCLLLGNTETQNQDIIEKWSTGISMTIGKKKPPQLQTQLKNAVSQGFLDFSENKFIDSLKEYIENNAKMQACSLTEAVNQLLEIIFKTKEYSYYFSDFIKQAKKNKPPLSKRQNISEQQALEYQTEQRVIPKIATKLIPQDNKKWLEIIEWAKQKDQQANKNNEQKIVKRDFGYIISPHSLIGGLIVFVLIGFYFIAPHIVSEIFKTMKNFLGEEAFLPTLAVGALTMGIIRGAWGRSRYEAQQDQIEVKTFRKEQQDAEEQIRSCLENLYKLRIVEYVNDTNTNNNAGPAIAIKIAANYLDWKTNAEQDKITRPKRDKKSVREISAKQPPAEASVKQQPTKDIYTNEYTYTTTQVIRKFIYHQTKYNFSLERKALNAIPDEIMRKRFNRSFKTSLIGTTGNCIRLLSNKTQAEVKVKGVDDRIFGLQEENNSYHFDRFEPGLH